MDIVYKILDGAEWRAARRTGAAPLSEADRADGYVHLCTEEQVLETASRHFRGRRALVAVAFDAACLGPRLRWEISRGGAAFPHLYAPLPADRALFVRSLIETPDGAFAFADGCA